MEDIMLSGWCYIPTLNISPISDSLWNTLSMWLNFLHEIGDTVLQSFQR